MKQSRKLLPTRLEGYQCKEEAIALRNEALCVFFYIFGKQKVFKTLKVWVIAKTMDWMSAQIMPVQISVGSDVPIKFIDIILCSQVQTTKQKTLLGTIVVPLFIFISLTM